MVAAAGEEFLTLSPFAFAVDALVGDEADVPLLVSAAPIVVAAAAADAVGEAAEVEGEVVVEEEEEDDDDDEENLKNDAALTANAEALGVEGEEEDEEEGDEGERDKPFEVLDRPFISLNMAERVYTTATLLNNMQVSRLNMSGKRKDSKSCR